ncbi:DUF3850 domain-containing protein [Salmonella enterica]|nr:DUF3850 domain-containing protein [Salmonella enterica]EDV0455512.1 DUF3850 domain-containing protein [Salmonella enterica subsp. enterica]ECJ6056460.1 DUF3850 domain-containing protein [Salmonella enterica]ECJ6172747.1 DUF3850 domain-containing protein [Salmonella enterica]EDV1768696.1 DUF3850 domain-containing protein [Salmonella enterica]
MTNNKLTDKRIHELKIYPEFFSAVCAGTKRAELRMNDRSYRAGDVLRLCEYDNGALTGDAVDVDVVHVADVGYWCPGYVVLSIELQERRKAGERLQESAYKSGLTAGWNFGIEHNSAGFSKCLAAHEYAAPQPALQPSVGFVDATGTDCECVCPACKHEFSIQFEY